MDNKKDVKKRKLVLKERADEQESRFCGEDSGRKMRG